MTTLTLKQVEHIKQTADSFNAVTLYKVEVKVAFDCHKINSLNVKGGGKEADFVAADFAGKSFNEIMIVLVDAFCAATKNHNNA